MRRAIFRSFLFRKNCDTLRVRVSQKRICIKCLKIPFYVGNFSWRGQTYKGTHPVFIDPQLYALAQLVLRGHNKPKYGKRNIAFRGMLTCAHDNCTVTAEVKKGKYIYYRCTGHRGKCGLPRFREEEIAGRLGHVLKDVAIPEEVARSIGASLQRVHVQMRDRQQQERARLKRELGILRDRMDAAYTDKLDGKISESFWQRKQAEWQSEETRIESLASELTEDSASEKLLNMQRILELAQNAHSIYLTQKPAEQAELLKKVVLNCSIDAISLYPTYRKPFDLIFKRAKCNEWSGREDLNLRPPGPELSSVDPCQIFGTDSMRTLSRIAVSPAKAGPGPSHWAKLERSFLAFISNLSHCVCFRRL